MGERDREQAKDRGNTDVVRDERGRGGEEGRGPYQTTRWQARQNESDVVERTADDSGREAHESYRAGIEHPSPVGGKKGRAAGRRDDPGETERPDR